MGVFSRERESKANSAYMLVYGNYIAFLPVIGLGRPGDWGWMDAHGLRELHRLIEVLR